jgi:hypothetical protein
MYAFLDEIDSGEYPEVILRFDNSCKCKYFDFASLAPGSLDDLEVLLSVDD